MKITNLLKINIKVISQNLRGSYIESPDWIKNKKAATNPINKKIVNVLNVLQQLLKIMKE